MKAPHYLQDKSHTPQCYMRSSKLACCLLHFLRYCTLRFLKLTSDTSVPLKHAALFVYNVFCQLLKFLLNFQEIVQVSLPLGRRVYNPPSQVSLESHRTLHYTVTVCLLLCVPYKPGSSLKVQTPSISVLPVPDPGPAIYRLLTLCQIPPEDHMHFRVLFQKTRN